MPRLLSLPLSELFTEPSGAASAESFPSPWHGAPLPIALKARQLAEDAALFSDAPGRRNVLVCRADNDDPAQQSILLIASQSPADFVLPDPNETLPMADRIAGKTSCGAFEEAARSVEILTMAGTRTSLLAFAESDRARRPPKIARGGAAGLNLTFEHWNRALLDAVESPLAANLLAAAQARAAGRKLTALASMEWWRGSAPIYDVKWDGMALSPKTTTKPLVEFLLEGIPFASDPRVNSPVTQSLRPRILLEHRDFIAVFKPSGLLSVPGTGGLPNALTIASEMTGTSLTAVHRLDMDTSGILLYGKTPEGIRSLMAAFREGRVEKRYRAVLEGRLPAECGLIDFPITTHPLDRLRQIAALGGREARTQWRRLSEKTDVRWSTFCRSQAARISFGSMPPIRRSASMPPLPAILTTAGRGSWSIGRKLRFCCMPPKSSFRIRKTEIPSAWRNLSHSASETAASAQQGKDAARP